jgi:hypothetical protein
MMEAAGPQRPAASCCCGFSQEKDLAPMKKVDICSLRTYWVTNPFICKYLMLH